MVSPAQARGEGIGMAGPWHCLQRGGDGGGAQLPGPRQSARRRFPSRIRRFYWPETTS